MSALLLLLIVGCENRGGFYIDPPVKHILSLQDRRQVDSLKIFLTHKNDDYRALAARGFASVQDSTVTPELGKILLSDPSIAVRRAAAYALGQTPGRSGAPYLLQALRVEQDKTVRREAIEAYGKVAWQWDIPSPEDSSDIEGTAWAFYRLGLRGRSDSALSRRAVKWLHTGRNTSTRLAAAHYFARGGIFLPEAIDAIVQSALHDEDGEVRMAATLALRQAPADSALNVLRAASKDVDYRVRVNAIRALQSIPLASSRELLLSALVDPQLAVGVAAAEVLVLVADTTSFDELVKLARQAPHWRIQGTLLKAATALRRDSLLRVDIMQRYRESDNAYFQASLLGALGNDPGAANFLDEQFFATEFPIVRQAAAAAMTELNNNKALTLNERLRFADFFRRAMLSGDIAAIGIIAGVLRDTTLHFRELFRDYQFLYAVRDKLRLPKDYEAFAPLLDAIAFFENEEHKPPLQNSYNHPIDWAMLDGYLKEPTARIQTTKGDIVIRLFPEEAPGSVANFIALVKQQYYNGLFFHRVVPNFVIQAGCYRGDGWGGEDYSLRSEFSGRRYKTGSVGMASAGKDTEGTQWFITHSPTPHLDGRYTIFAEVVSGMDVVHQIEVGDKILNIELK